MPSYPAKWADGVDTTLDAAAAVDKGGGLVGLPITAHPFQVGQTVTISDSTNYDGSFLIVSETVDEIVITVTYAAETFAGTETVVFGKVPILKSDFQDLWEAVGTQPSVRMQPTLVWVSTSVVKIAATANCPAAMQFTGMPNILNPNTLVSGGLSDGNTRMVTADVTCDFGSAGLYGTTQTEKEFQWYVIFAVAGDEDTDFTLTAMPFMRVKSQASQTISLGTLVDPSVGIGYGFTTDDLVGGMVYMLSGASKGLMRAISANNNDDSTGGTITYTGDALTVAQDDWLIVLPPTNFRWIGSVFNNDTGAVGDIVEFRRLGQGVQWVNASAFTSGAGGAVMELIKACCPLAVKCGVTTNSADLVFIGHSACAGAGYEAGLTYVSDNNSAEFYLELCEFYISIISDTMYFNYYEYPVGSTF